MVSSPHGRPRHCFRNMKLKIILSITPFISCSLAISNGSNGLKELWLDLVSTCRETLLDHICSEFNDQETRVDSLFQELEKSYEIVL
jgi:hypothetical protein